MEAVKKINLSRRKNRRGQIGTVGGRPPYDDRLIVTAIWYVMRTGLSVAGCAGAVWFVEFGLHALATLDGEWLMAPIVGAIGSGRERNAAALGLFAYQIASGRNQSAGWSTRAGYRAN